ncbi:hypothetical protein N7523_001112 [Penicillium sp. IBT 18751x]|nr:hypothetical protein N7523_001112 [Penicillium sp. IBT 18751x]
MTAITSRNLRDRIIGATISCFGFAYFFIFLLQFLLFHFPSSQESIPEALAVIAFGGGISLWYLGILFHQFLPVLHNEHSEEQQDSLRVGGLVLIWVAAIPTIVFLFPAQPLLQLGYASALTVVVIGNLPEEPLYHPASDASSGEFSLHLASVILLSLTPTIHTLAESVPRSASLAIAFGRIMMTSLLACAFYLLQPLERIGLAKTWQPSLHGMYLVLTYSLVAYSKSVMQAAIAHVP